MPSIYDAYQANPPFPDDAQLDITGHLQVLHRNAVLLEALTREGRAATCAHAYLNETVNDNPHAYATWAVLYRVGADTLTWKGRKTAADTVATMTLRFEANGVLLQEGITLTVGVDTTYSWDLTTIVGLTLVDGDAVVVTLELYDDASPGGPPDGLGAGRAWGRLHTTALYLASLAGAATRSWPGEPAITTSPTAALMAQLGAALDYCAERVALVPRPLFTAIAHGTGTFSDAVSPMQIWRGGAERSVMDRLKLEGAITVVSNPGETVRLLINDAQAAITGTLTPAATAYSISFDVDVSSYGATDPLRLEVQDTRSDTTGTRPSRITVSRVWLASTAAALTMPTLPAPEASGTWATARTYLNDLAGVVGDIKARIDAAPDLYDRAHAYRLNYGYDAGERAYFGARHLAYGRGRGRRLVVCGRGVSIGWGAPTWALADDAEPDGPYTLESAFTQNLIGGTAWDAGETGVETRMVYLDEIGVPPGVRYVLQGEVRGAWELL